MEYEQSQVMRKSLVMFILIVLPLFLIAIGLIFNLMNAWFYILSATWFTAGIIFYGALR